MLSAYSQNINFTHNSCVLLGATSARNTTVCNGKIVAVLDTGIYSDSSNPLSNSSLLPNLSTTKVGFNNNGSYTVSNDLPCGLSCAGRDHGTHVGGIIGESGVLAYTESICGVAPETTVLMVNVFTQFTGSTCTSQNLSSPCMVS